jgi:pimeloyl-ACP methyl ester carboxylesterase
VYASGPADATPILLFHAYQATSAEWLPLAALLSSDRRVYAVDMMGDAGHSVPGSRSVSTPDDLVAYLDTVLDGLGLTSAELGGHSFGAWIVLTYAINRPSRVDKLTLLDPTMAFSPLLPHYVIRALPALYKPSSAHRVSLIRWETRKAELDPKWLQATGLGVDAFSGMPSVPTKIPSTAVRSAMDRPTLVILAAKGRVHNVRRIAAKVNRLPNALVTALPKATHYGITFTHAGEIAELMRKPLT